MAASVRPCKPKTGDIVSYVNNDRGGTMEKTTPDGYSELGLTCGSNIVHFDKMGTQSKIGEKALLGENLQQNGKQVWEDNDNLPTRTSDFSGGGGLLQV